MTSDDDIKLGDFPFSTSSRSVWDKDSKVGIFCGPLFWIDRGISLKTPCSIRCRLMGISQPMLTTEDLSDGRRV